VGGFGRKIKILVEKQNVFCAAPQYRSEMHTCAFRYDSYGTRIMQEGGSERTRATKSSGKGEDLLEESGKQKWVVCERVVGPVRSISCSGFGL
jgi:hypothetical protein